MTQIAVCFWTGYLIGGINPAYLIARLKGFDIRRHGSKNAGASNAVITMGKAVGAFSALFDVSKAVFAVFLAEQLCDGLLLARPIAGAACILGHIFPLFMRFRGGKGLACLGGVILAFDYRLFLILFVAELLLALFVDYICVVPITASVLFPMLYGWMTQDRIGTCLYTAVAVIIFCKHLENIQRIRRGTEAHLSFLWRKGSELARLQAHIESAVSEQAGEEE